MVRGIIPVIPYDEHELIPGCENYHEAIGEVASAFFSQNSDYQRVDYRYPIVFWRKKRGMTQAALAELVGISQSYLAQVELKHRVGDVNLYAKIASELNVRIDDIVNEPTIPNVVTRLGNVELIEQTKKLSSTIYNFGLKFRKQYETASGFHDHAFKFEKEEMRKRLKISSELSHEFAITFIYRYLPKVLALESELSSRLGQEIINDQSRSSVLRNKGVTGNLDFEVLSRYLRTLAEKLDAGKTLRS